MVQYNIINICIDILYFIFDYLSFIDKLKTKIACKKTNQLTIKDLTDLQPCLISKINVDILKNYPHVTKLRMYAKENIDISFLKELKYLSITRCFKIEQFIIINIDNFSQLETLNVEYVRIICTKTIPSLKKLSIHGNCIGIESFNFLKLESMIIYFNDEITDLNRMLSLKELEIIGESKINNNGINKLNLKSLYLEDNEQITDLNHQTSLKELMLYGSSKIDDLGIKDLKLKSLTIHTDNDEELITDLNQMTTLKSLSIPTMSSIKYEKLKLKEFIEL